MAQPLGQRGVICRRWEYAQTDSEGEIVDVFIPSLGGK